MTSTLELYRRAGLQTLKERREPIEETEQKFKVKHINVYHKNGMEWQAKSVKLDHFKNINGTKGKASYAITFMDGQTRYYPREEIVGIVPITDRG